MASFVQVVICCLSPDKCQSAPTKYDGRAVLFAVAELLVQDGGHRVRNVGLLLGASFVMASVKKVKINLCAKFYKISQFTAEIKLLPVSENGPPAYWTTSGFDLDVCVG